MKKLTFLFLSFCLMAGSITAQKGFKLDRDEMGEVIEDIDWGLPFPETKTKFPGPILKKYQANKSMIKKRYGLSEKQYDAIAIEVFNKLEGKSAKQLKRMERKQLKMGSEDIKFLMETVQDEHQDDNANVQAQQSGAQDILDAGVSGASVGAALGAGIGAVAGAVGGPKGAVAGAAIGGAIGGAIGAAAGLGAGAGTEIAEEIDPSLENN